MSLVSVDDIMHSFYSCNTGLPSCYLANNYFYLPKYFQVLSNIKVSRILFSTYVIQNDKRGSDWNFAQFEELQLLVSVKV